MIKLRNARNPVLGPKTKQLVVRNFFLPAGSSSSLLYLQDTLSSRCFLVDSVTVFPAPASSSNSGIRLVTANRSAMTYSGSRIIPLQFAHGEDKDSSWHPCRDYHHLNTTTIPDSYSLPNISDFTSGSQVFSKLDLHKGYYQEQ